MAIDKSRTSPAMKAMIILLAVVFAVSLMAVSVPAIIDALSGNGQSAAGASGSKTTTQTVDAIGQQAAPTIRAIEASLTVEPKNYDLLVQQANSYFEWALAVRQAIAGTTRTDDQPIWKMASSYYERALKVKPGDPNVMTDYSVTIYYSNQPLQAVVLGEQIAAKNPKFAPIQFNLGLYYETLGDKANAKKALQKYLELDPNGANAATAKERLAALAK